MSLFSKRFFRLLLNSSLVFFAVFCFFGFSSSVHAATVTFDNSAGTGTWEGPTNWDTNTVPTAADTVIIGTTVAVTATSTIDFSTLQVGNGTLTASLTLTGNIGTGGSITIKNAGTLIQNNAVQQTLSGTLTIESGGTLKSGNNTTAQSYIVNFSVATIALNAGGTITTDALGYDGHTVSSAGSGPGGGAGGFAGGGGAHGGDGGVYSSNARAVGYCDFTDVDTMGSGGGGSSGGGGDGGAGGGLIILTASGTATLSGILTADGAAGTATHGGGGAGGGIKITADTIAGTPSSFTATGGAANTSGGAGGGGCVQLVYTTASSLSASSIYASAAMTASGSSTGDDSSPGIFYIKQVGSDGDLVLKNAALSASAATTVSTSLSINNLYLGYASSSFSGVTVNTSITADNGSMILIRSGEVFTLAGGISSITKSGTGPTFDIFGTLNATGLGNLSSTTIDVYNGGTWDNNSTITSNSDTNITLQSGATVVNNFNSLSSAGTFGLSQGVATITDLTVSGGTMTLRNFTTSTALSLTNLIMTGGSLTHAGNSSSHTHIVNVSATTITMSSTSTISADGLGFDGGAVNNIGKGPGGGPTGTHGSGGSHGGNGAIGSGVTQAAAYCAFTDLGTMGSGGGGGSSSVGGAGGGLIILNASGTATLNGTLTADGSAGGSVSGYGGGGSGGGIKVTANTIAGTPTSLTATSGSAGGSNAGAGGGGCIQLEYTTANSLSGSTVFASAAMTAKSGTTGADGGPGIFYIKQVGSDGDLVMKNSVIGSTDVATIVSTTLSINNLYLDFASSSFSGVTINTSLTMANGSSIQIPVSHSFTIAGGISSITKSGTGPTFDIFGTLNATGLGNFSSTTIDVYNGGTWNNNSTITSNSDTNITLQSGATVVNNFNSLSSAGTFNLSQGVGSITDLTVSGGTMTLRNFTTSTALSLTNLIMTGGSLTHAGNSSSHTHIVNVSATTITMSSTSTISADGLGFDGGAVNNIGKGPGGGPTGTHGSGGSHGGNGGIGSGVTEALGYCAFTDVGTMGSGGGGGSASVGGAGGGLIILNASGTATLNGTLTADGSAGGSVSGYGGGGSGGGIKVTANTIAGTPTSLTATSGSAGAANAGAGGGGCIQLEYTTANSLSGSTVFASAAMTAKSGTNGADGGAGIFYIKQVGSDGDLVMKNSAISTGDVATIVSTTLSINNLYLDFASSSFAGVTVNTSVTANNGSKVNVKSGGIFTLGAGVSTIASTGTGPTFTVQGNMTANSLTSVVSSTFSISGTWNATSLSNLTGATVAISSGGTWNNSSTMTTNGSTSITLNSGSTVSNTFTSLSSAGTLNISSGTVSFTDLTVSAGTVTLSNFTTSTALSVAGTLNITGGTLTHTANTSSQTHMVNVSAGTITLGASGTVSANSKGFSGGASSSGSGQGPGGGTGNGTAGGGGGYGGLGSTGTSGGAGGPAYCTVTNVEKIGSGGGARTTGVGGAGGGLIWLTSTGTTTISGTLAATGANGSATNGAGGSGGGIKIRARAVEGTPASLTVIGGNGSGNGGGGGGGCVQVSYTTSASISSATLTKGTGGAGGANGLFGSGSSGATVSAISGDTTEANGTATFTVVLLSAPLATVEIPVSSSDTTEGTVNTSTLSFSTSDWNIARTVTVTGVDDSVDDGNIAYSIALGAASSTDGNYNSLNPDDVSVSNTDNDTAGFTVSAISGNTSEAGGTATFTVVLTSQPTDIVTTTVYSSNTAEGTINTSTLVFTADSWNLSRTVTVTGVNDLVVDGDIAYSIILDTATSTDPNYSGVNPDNVSVTNTDDDVGGADGVTITESAGTTNITEGGATDSYTIVLDALPSGDVYVNIAPDAQSTVSTSSIVFSTTSWDTPQTITVTAVNDAVVEGAHTSTITHSATSTDGGYDGIAIGDVVANVTDNDTAGFTVSAISGNTTEVGGTATFTVVLGSQPTGIVTTSIQSSDTTEGTITTSTLVFSPTDWNFVRTITVTGVDDSVDDGDIAYSIILDTATSTDDVNYAAVNPADVAVTNTDNDTAGVTLAESGGTTDITEGGATDSYTVVLNTQPTDNVAIHLGTDGESTLSTSSITFQTSNWNVARTVTVTAVDDGDDEGGHTSTITHSATSTDGNYDAIVVADVVATVTDNDDGGGGIPGFTVSAISGNTTEAGGTATFTVVLDAEPTGIVTTTVYSSNTAEGTINTSTLVFAPTDWNLTRTVTVTGINDDLDDGDVIYTIILDTATSTDLGYDGINPNDVTVTNTDNDTVGVTVTEVGGTTDITEGGATDTYTLVLNSEPTGNVAVSLSADADSTVSTSSIVFTVANWDTAQTITVTAADDAISEGAHTSTITHSATSTDPGYDGIAIGDVVANVTDNDTAGFTLSLISASTTEAGGTGTFTVVLNSQPAGIVTSSIQSFDTTEGTITTSTLVFSPSDWNLARTITVTGVDDTVDDGDIAYSIVLDPAESVDDVNYNGVMPGSVDIVNIDNDTAGVTVTESAGTTDITEGGATDTYTLVLNSEPTGNVAVSISADADSTISTSSIIFTSANWNTAQTITVTAVNDLVIEGAHTSTVTHSATSTDGGYDAIAIADVVASVTDNDSAGFTVSLISASTTEAGGSATFTVVLNSEPAGIVTTTVHSNDTTEGTIATSTLVFSPADWNLARTVTVTGADDILADGNINYSIILDTATSTDDVNYAGINPSDVDVTNIDNDVVGITLVESGGTTNIAEGGATDSYTIVLDTQPTGDVAVSVLVDADSTVSTSSIVFNPSNWNTARTVTVTAVDDALVEGDHTSTITHTATSTDLGYDAIGVADVTADITDNDEAGFTVSAISGNTTEAGGTATFTVVLNTEPTGIVTTTVYSSDTTEGTINTSTLVFHTNDWNIARTVTVTGMNDDIDDGDIVYTIILDTATSTDLGYNGINPNNVTVTNTDNDTAGVTVTQSGGTTNITEGAATDSYTIVLNTQPTGDVTVSLSSDAQSTISTSSITFNVANWNIARTVTVTAVNDNLDEGPHTSTIDQSVASGDVLYDGIVVADITASITDNDTAGITLTQSGGTTNLTEGAATDSYTIVLNSQPSSSVNITITPDAQSTISTSSINFTSGNWDTPQTITVTAVNDILAEGPHTSTLTHSATSTDTNYDAIVIGDITANITDNEEFEVLVTQSGGTTNITEGGATDSYTLVLGSQPSGTVNIVIDPDAEATVSTSSINFTPGNWDTPQTITVTAVDDSIAEGPDTSTLTHTVSSTDGGYDDLAVADVTANITDNDTAGVTVTQSGGTTNITEGGATDSYTIVLNTEPTDDVVITVTPDAQSTVSTSSITITPGRWNIPVTVTVTAEDDLDIEGPHTSTITHSAESLDLGYNNIAIGDITANIIDNDTAGVTITESGGTTDMTEGGAVDSYTIVLNALPVADVTISVTPDDDSTVSTSSITFNVANWNIPRTVTTTAVDDDQNQGPHTSTLTHAVASADLSYDGIAANDVIASITDNDTAGFTVSVISGNTTEALATSSYTIVLNSEPLANVTVSVTSSNANEGTASVTSITFTSLNWDTPVTVTVTGTDDSIDDGDVVYSIVNGAAVSADGNYNNLNPADVSVTNTDNDTAGVSVTQSGGTTNVTEGGATDSYTLVLDTQPTEDVTITVAPDANSTVSTSSIIFTASNWNVEQTITVTADDNHSVDGPHDSTITHSAASADGNYDGIAIADVTANVTDNDVAGFTVSAISGDTSEAGGSSTFTVVLNTQPTGNVTTTVTSSDLTEGTVNTSTLVFHTNDWDVARTVTVTGVNDDSDDGDIVSTIVLGVAVSGDGNYDGINPADVTFTNVDNDGVGVNLVQSGGSTDITEAGATDSYTIVLGSAPFADVVITVAPDADATVSTSSITFTADNWNTSVTVTVTAVNDALDEGNHTSTITHTAASADGAYDAIVIANITANITDNDEVVVEEDPTEEGGGGGGGAITIPTIPVIPAVSSGSSDSDATQVIIFQESDTEPLDFATTNHTVTRLSSTDNEATLIIQSDPITVHLKKEIPQILDTDGNGMPDLQVVYNGLVAKNPKFTFTQLQELAAVTINNGASQTFSSMVRLQFNVVNASMIAISNSPDFIGATFQTFTTNSVWALPFGDGQKTVFVRFRSKSGGNFDTTATIKLVHTAVTCSVSLGRAYKSPNSNAVYYITPPYTKDGQIKDGACTKRAFRSASVFFTYFGAWSDVQVIPQADLDAIALDELGFMPRGPRYTPQNGTLIKIVSDPNVYLVLNGEKRVIVSEQIFKSLGFEWSSVEDVAPELLDTFGVGAAIAESQAPAYSVIKYANSPRLYLLEPSESDATILQKRYIVDEQSWKKLNYRTDRVITLPTSTTYPNGTSIGNEENSPTVNTSVELSSSNFTQPLRIGSTGTEVEALQKILANQGYFDHEVTGLYGLVTEEAVKAFQRAHDLEPLGTVGPGTRAILNTL